MTPDSGFSAITPRDLRTEYGVDPVGIDAPLPRLSWQLRSAERGAIQTGYQIQVAASPAALSSGPDRVWW